MRSIAFEIPPAADTWAPKSMRRRYFRRVRPRSHGSVAHRAAAHRRRAHVPLQLALRARPRRRVPAADREHGYEPRGRGVRRADRALAALARHRVGRRDDVPARRHGARGGGGAPARRRRHCVRGRGRDPHPHARRGRDRLGRRDQGAHRGAERRARGRRPRPLGRPSDLQLRLAARGLDRRHHPRHPRRRPRLEHAEADQRPARARRRAARVRARPERVRRRRQEALEAPRRGVGRRVPRCRVRAGGADELPRAPRLGARRRDDDHVRGRSSSSASRSSASARAPRRSTTRSSTG